MPTKGKEKGLQGIRMPMFAVWPEELTLVTDKEHHLYDPRVNDPVDERWVAAAMANGMPDEIKVKKDGDKLLVIDGRQRTKCCVEANKRLRKQGLEPIRVRITCEKGDEASVVGLMISSNELRREDSVSNKAFKLQRFMATGKSRQEAAVVFGVDKHTIGSWIDYQELSAPLKKAVDSGALSATAARAFKDLPAEKQKEELEKLKVAGVKPTVEVTRQIAAGKPAGKPKPSPKRIGFLLTRPEIPAEFFTFIKWLRGEASQEDLEEILPWTKEPPEVEGKVEVTRAKRTK